MFNPLRRNRKIGKTQGGRVRDGKAVEKRSRVFTQDIWTRLLRGATSGLYHLTRKSVQRLFSPSNRGRYSFRALPITPAHFATTQGGRAFKTLCPAWSGGPPSLSMCGA